MPVDPVTNQRHMICVMKFTDIKNYMYVSRNNVLFVSDTCTEPSNPPLRTKKKKEKKPVINQFPYFGIFMVYYFDSKFYNLVTSGLLRLLSFGLLWKQTIWWTLADLDLASII